MWRGELALGASLAGGHLSLGRPQVAQRCAVLLLMPASAAAWAVGRGRARKHRVCSKLRSLTQRDNDMAASKRALEGTN
jgi:hypothetical protein